MAGLARDRWLSIVSIGVPAVLLACGNGLAPLPDGPDDPLPPPPSGDSIQLVEVASGFDQPVYLTAPPNDGRLFIVELAGRIRIVENGQLVGTPFLDITGIVRSGGERGLLSMAFAPDYASSGHFYVSYTDNAGNTRIARYAVSADPNVADAGSAKTILSVGQPFSNHNGGLVMFGPDGMLYVGLGDGGSGGDPQNHGQNRGTLLGALLRIDVEAGDPYGIPADNPFVSDPNARDEIWAFGLRNPWRFSFDFTDDVLYVADVGQNAFEEVSAVSASTPGLNYGWRLMEGNHCFNPSNCDPGGLTLPVVEYGHGPECSVTGGFVYRGQEIPAIQGHYFYSDFCAGWLRSFKLVNGVATEQQEWDVGSVGNVTSFGEDAAGELYVVVSSGRVFRIEEAGT